MAAPPSSPLEPLMCQVRELLKNVRPSVVALKSFFSVSDPNNGELKQSSRTGAGVFVDRSLIITSAHVVGIVSTDSGSTAHSCSVGRTFAVTTEGKVLNTKLVAVSFGGDVAVLEAEVEGDADLPPPCAVASSVASKERPLVLITRHENCDGGGVTQMKVRALEDNRGRTEWPYEFDDDLGWARYGGSGDDEDEFVPGSPWFSLRGQVVGMASWAVGSEEANSAGGFVVPPPRIRSVLDYAKGKAPHDPVVLDRWITAVTFADSDAVDQPKESFQNVPSFYLVTLYLNISVS